jgi:glutamate decarboxylase
VLRIVARNGFSRDLADLLLDDLRESVAELEHQSTPLSTPVAAFHH